MENNLPINQIICGDCLEIMKEFPDNSIDCIVVDLPYFKIVKDSWDNQWNTESDYLDWVESNILLYRRIIKENSNLFVFTGRTLNRKIATMLDKHFIEKRIIIWGRKRNFNQTRGHALASGYEPICYYTSGVDSVFNNIKIKLNTTRKEYVSGTLKEGITLSDLWLDIPALPHNSKERVCHPTQKPIKLIERLLLVGTRIGDTILDPCAGSGTTCLAAKRLGRNYIGIDISEEYCELANQRIDNELNQGDLFRNI